MCSGNAEAFHVAMVYIHRAGIERENKNIERVRERELGQWLIKKAMVVEKGMQIKKRLDHEIFDHVANVSASGW